MLSPPPRHSTPSTASRDNAPNAHCPSFCDDPHLLAIPLPLAEKGAHDEASPLQRDPCQADALSAPSSSPPARNLSHNRARLVPSSPSRVQSTAAPQSAAAHTHSLSDTSRVSSRQCTSPLEQGSGRAPEDLERGQIPSLFRIPSRNAINPGVIPTARSAHAEPSRRPLHPLRSLTPSADSCVSRHLPTSAATHHPTRPEPLF